MDSRFRGNDGARFVSLLLILMFSGCVHRVSESENRTVVFVAREIHTMDPQQPSAQALVMRDGKFAFVGTEKAALSFAGSDATVERWPDSTIVPGLIDAHGHLASLGRTLSILSLEGTTSEASALEKVKAPPKSAYQGEWLLGRGWDQNDWPSQKFPSKEALDALWPKTPVFLSRIDGHAAWVNSEALARAGISKDTRDPAGGHIERNSRGEPTGILTDNAMDLIAAKIPEEDDKTTRQRMKVALETCARLGLTQVHDAGMTLKDFEILQSWDFQNVLPIRVYAMADGQGAEATTFIDRGIFSGRHLQMRAVKLLADGALGSRGAALNAPYADDPKNSGYLLLSDADFHDRVKRFADRGFQVAVHAIGDRAISWVLDALETLPADQRNRVEHVQILAAADLSRFSAHGIIASYQPTHATSDMPWAEQRVGPERLALAYAWKSMLDSGARIAFGSDFPVENPNPLLGLYAARTRQDVTGRPIDGWYPAQKLSGETALKAFTVDNAYASFAEDRRGMIRDGFDADFVILPVDPVNDVPAAMLKADVQMTVVDGVDVYRRAP